MCVGIMMKMMKAAISIVEDHLHLDIFTRFGKMFSLCYQSASKKKRVLIHVIASIVTNINPRLTPKGSRSEAPRGGLGAEPSAE